MSRERECGCVCLCVVQLSNATRTAQHWKMYLLCYPLCYKWNTADHLWNDVYCPGNSINFLCKGRNRSGFIRIVDKYTEWGAGCVWVCVCVCICVHIIIQRMKFKPVLWTVKLSSVEDNRIGWLNEVWEIRKGLEWVGKSEDGTQYTGKRTR